MAVGTMRPLDTIRETFGQMGREVRATPEVVDKLFQGVLKSALEGREIECFLEEKEKERFLVNWVGDCASYGGGNDETSRYDS
mmetsp:Transcript_17572/g.71103  ORF Transcript_17572/g.71103 Transcript_17572/m.71103 type:complete len:83 (-) Transcript_17572:70-318(-)